MRILRSNLLKNFKMDSYLSNKDKKYKMPYKKCVGYTKKNKKSKKNKKKMNKSKKKSKKNNKKTRKGRR